MSRFGFSCWLIASCTAPLACGAPLPQEVAPLYRITIERSIQAVNYRPNGSTNIDFKGTALAFESKGKADVSTQRGVVRIQAKFEDLPPATSFGPEFLTYVLWAISPEGRARNLGELVLKNQHGELKTTTSLQAFGMMLTAEPYYAVTIPSDVVVMENVVRRDTLGSTTSVDAKFELLQRGDYAKAGLQQMAMNPDVPLDLYQARNAVQIAKSAKAERYSADSLIKATKALQNAEGYQSRKKRDRKLVVMSAREAVQGAEDARVIATRRAGEELLAAQKAEAAAREAAAIAEAQREAQRKRDAEQAAALAKAEAQRAAQQKREAELTAALAKAEAERQAQQKREADMAAALAQAARARAELEEERAKREAEVARTGRLKAETEQRELRARLLSQFNAILETRDTTRGLVVNMGDVLFDTGKFDLRPPAREALARLSGIVLSHPGLKLEIEGHTDSVGGDEFNQELSEKRAGTVRQYLLAQRLPGEILTSQGFGKTMPVASNDSVQGRQQNRRVEIVVSGEVIGVDINVPAAQGRAAGR